VYQEILQRNFHQQAQIQHQAPSTVAVDPPRGIPTEHRSAFAVAISDRVGV
jgi:hypothetical protein